VRVIRHQAKQVHPVPDHMVNPRGPFPRELFDEPEIIYDNIDDSEYGGNMALGGTVQNNFKPPKVMRCGSCFARVMENETEHHVCEE